jgi:hypothetical protein
VAAALVVPAERPDHTGNTDPSTTEPAGGHCSATDPHVMVFPTRKRDRTLDGTNPRSGLPHIRWAGTPYEHVAVPAPGK